MTLDTQLERNTPGKQHCFCLNPNLVPFLLYPMAFERRQDKLGEGVLLSSKGG